VGELEELGGEVTGNLNLESEGHVGFKYIVTINLHVSYLILSMSGLTYWVRSLTTSGLQSTINFSDLQVVSSVT